MEPIPSFTLVLAPLAAVILHEFVLRRVEVDHLAVPIIGSALATYWILVYYSDLVTATLVTSSFWVPLWLYIGAYRAFFHPLRTYPGPWAAKLSRWWAIKQTWDSDLHYHRVLQRLQTQYGDYVRTGPLQLTLLLSPDKLLIRPGPRELTIFDAEAIQPILGAQSKTTKGPFFDVMERSLHLNRDKAFHRQRRRTWDTAFKTALPAFAPQVEHFTDQLLERLRREEGQLIPLIEYTTYYSYDVMAALAFGQPMGFINGDHSDIAASLLATFTKSVTLIGYMYHMPWLMNTIGSLTSFAGPMKEWRDWSVSQMRTRMQVIIHPFPAHTHTLSLSHDKTHRPRYLPP